MREKTRDEISNIVRMYINSNSFAEKSDVELTIKQGIVDYNITVVYLLELLLDYLGVEFKPGETTADKLIKKEKK